MTSGSDVRTEKSALLFFDPPETILQECWNVGLLFTPLWVIGHLVLAVETTLQQSLGALPVTLFALAMFLWFYHEDNRGAYIHV